MKICADVKIVTEGDRDAKALLGCLMVAQKALCHDVDEYREIFAQGGVAFDHKQWLDDHVSVLRRLLPAILLTVTLSAAPITFQSDPTDTCAPAPCTVGSITPHPSWTGGPWISFTDSGANAGMLTVPNGTVVSFFEHLTIAMPVTHAPIRFSADDSASLSVNGTLVQPEAPAAGNGYSTCSDFGVTCTSWTEIDIAPWLVVGNNELRFDVAQRGRWGFGASWIGEVGLVDIGDPPVLTPEPGTWIAMLVGIVMLCFVSVFYRQTEEIRKLKSEIYRRDHYIGVLRKALRDVAATITDGPGLREIARRALEDDSHA